MRLVYISSPYTHKDNSIVRVRAARAAQLTAKLQCEYGETHTLISPIVHGHQLEVTGLDKSLPHTWDYWEQHDLNLLKRCDEMWVMCMPGWDKSVGVTAEIEFCKGNNIPIQYFSREGVVL